MRQKRRGTRVIRNPGQTMLLTLKLIVLNCACHLSRVRCLSLSLSLSLSASTKTNTSSQELFSISTSSKSFPFFCNYGQRKKRCPWICQQIIRNFLLSWIAFHLLSMKFFSPHFQQKDPIQFQFLAGFLLKFMHSCNNES